jgi:anthranilate phosphoribosyltransferase
MRAYMHAITAPPQAIDLCGTGGDGQGTLNISTAASLVAAAAGAVVAKHGNRSATSKSGAADILEALGVKIDQTPEHAQAVLRETGIAFLFAQTHHPAMKHAAAARARIKQRTIFNLLGPLANPAGAKRQLVGIFAKDWLLRYAEALRILGCERAMVVHGRDGLDEITTTDATFVADLAGGKIRQLEISPEDAGIARAALQDLKGGDAAYNASRLRALLAGRKDAYRDIVLLNTSAALMVAGLAGDLREGAVMAARAIDNGGAMRKLDDLILATNR